MTDPEKKKLGLLLDEVFQLKLEWKCYERLFMHSDERSTILSKWIPDLSNALEAAISYNVITALCRLTENARSAQTSDKKSEKRNRNEIQTLPTVVSQLVATPTQELQREMRDLEDACRKIRGFRHKIIAHRDKEVADGKPLSAPHLKLGQLNDTVRRIENVAFSMVKAIDGSLTSFPTDAIEHNVDWLIACLAFGADHREEVVKIKDSLKQPDVKI